MLTRWGYSDVGDRPTDAEALTVVRQVQMNARLTEPGGGGIGTFV
ncbi:hypothetical protein ABIF90_008261 [Bradyrhizobium japonicum]